MAVKGVKQTPEQIRKRVEAVAKTRALWTDEQRESYANKVREANKKRDPETQRKFTHCHKGKPAWNKGEKMPLYSGSNHWNWGGKMPQESIEKMRQSLTGKKQSPELVQKRVDARAGYQHSEEVKEKIGNANSGDGNGNWLGGKSYEPYAPVFADKRFKAGIRERDNNECQNPDCRKNCDTLTIHHINYDKKNCEPKNLITLCNSCNARANYNREFWQAGYTEIITQKHLIMEQQIAV